MSRSIFYLVYLSVPQVPDVKPSYFSVHQARDLTDEISGRGGRERRPSCVEVYGSNDAVQVTAPRKTPPPPPPPPVVLPEITEHNECDVISQIRSPTPTKSRSRPTTAADIEYIAKSAAQSGITSGQKVSIYKSIISRSKSNSDQDGSTIETAVHEKSDDIQSDIGKPPRPPTVNEDCDVMKDVSIPSTGRLLDDSDSPRLPTVNEESDVMKDVSIPSTDRLLDDSPRPLTPPSERPTLAREVSGAKLRLSAEDERRVLTARTVSNKDLQQQAGKAVKEVTWEEGQGQTILVPVKEDVEEES